MLKVLASSHFLLPFFLASSPDIRSGVTYICSRGAACADSQELCQLSSSYLQNSKTGSELLIRIVLLMDTRGRDHGYPPSH